MAISVNICNSDQDKNNQKCLIFMYGLILCLGLPQQYKMAKPACQKEAFM